MGLNDKRKIELENKYKNMETVDLICIVSTDKKGYEPEAVAIAEAELKRRNVFEEEIAEVSDSQKKEEKAKQERIATTTFSKRTKFFFTVFPGFGIWYSVFTPKEYVQRRKDVNRCSLMALGFYLAITLICLLLGMLHIRGVAVVVSVVMLMAFIFYKLS